MAPPTAEDIDEYRDDYRDEIRDERDDYRDERDDYRDDYRDERDDYGDDYRDDRDGDFYRDEERGDEYYDARSADRPKPKGYGRDSARPRYDSGGRSSSISSIAGQMRERRELGSTVAAIALSGVDFCLHVATAIFCQVEYYGEHSLFWAFITLGVFANMIAIVMHVVRSAKRREAGAEESELERKFKQRPEECVLVMMFGMVNTECLCFLTPDPDDHATFRKLGLLASVLEGVPTLGLQIAFLYTYGWVSLVGLALVWTCFTLALKLMRGWIICLSARCHDEARVALTKNLKLEDAVSLPLFIAHAVLSLALIAWLDYAALWRAFGVDYLSLLLELAGGLNATLAGYTEDTLVRVALNGSAGDGAGGVVAEAASGVVAEETPGRLVAPTLRRVAQDMLRGSSDVSVDVWQRVHEAGHGEVWGYEYEPSSYETTERARALLDEVVETRGKLQVTLGAVLAFFILGCIANVALLSAYIRLERFREHFHSSLLWRSSLSSALLGVGAMLNGGFINGLSQSAEGYRLAKRDSAAIFLLFHGIPVAAAASQVLVYLDCQHRSCAVQFRGSDATVYLYFFIVMAAPLIWWQVARLVMQMAAARLDLQHEPPHDGPLEQDAREPPAPHRTSPFALLGRALSSLACFVKWLLALLGMLHIYWNSPAHTGDGYLSDRGSRFGWVMAPPEGFVMGDGLTTTSYQFRLALGCFLFAMIFNLIAISTLLVRHSTNVLRRRLVANPGGAVLALTLSAVHPEFMGWMADRQHDVFNIGKLGLVSAIGDVPLLGVFAYVFEDVRQSGSDRGLVAYEDFEDAVLGLAISACVLHMAIYAARGVVFTLAAGLRRKNEGSLYSYLPKFGDGLTSLVGLVQFFLVLLLIITFDAGSHDGLTKPEDQRHMHNCMRVLAVTLGINMLCNFLATCSFLNHWVFSHEQLTGRPFASALVVILCVFDVSLLDLLSNDEQTDKDVKYVGMIIGLSTQLVPNLLVQIAVIMAIKVDFSGLTENWSLRERLDPESVVYASLAATVVMVVWRLLLVVVLHVTNREREFENPFHHTPLVLGPRWMENRRPTELAERDGRPTPRRGGPLGGRARMQPTPGWGGYDEDELEPPGTVEAECPQRALYRDESRQQGAYVFLGEDMPHLFLPVFGVRPLPRRGGREAMVRFRYAPEDVGGLDREFLEQNITTEPEAAWRAVNPDGGEPPPQEYDDDVALRPDAVRPDVPLSGGRAGYPGRDGYGSRGYGRDDGGGSGGSRRGGGGGGGGGGNGRDRRDGPSPRRDGPSPRRDGPSPRRDGPSPRRDSPIPRKDGPSPRRDAYGGYGRERRDDERRPSSAERRDGGREGGRWGPGERSGSGRGGKPPPSVPKLGIGGTGARDTSPLGPPPPPVHVPGGAEPDVALTPRTAARAAQIL